MKEFKIFGWSFVLVGTLGFFYFKNELDKLKAAQTEIQKTVSMGIRG